MTHHTSDEPMVDVGMPAYRRPESIAGAIESVLAQTHTAWRLVVSENGPGGGAVEAAVRAYTGDPRIRYEATGRNLGPAANWTRLLRAGSAPYVTVLQDDDFWDPGFLAARVSFLERHPSCAFVFSGERMLDGDAREIAVEQTRGLPERDVSEVLPEGVYQPEEFFPAMYRHRLGGIHTPSISSGGVMSRRSALESEGAYFDDSRPFLYWDVELYMRMALRFPSDFSRSGTWRSGSTIPASRPTPYDGERWIRYHDYYGELIRRRLPGVKLPRQLNSSRATRTSGRHWTGSRREPAQERALPGQRGPRIPAGARQSARGGRRRRPGSPATAGRA